MRLLFIIFSLALISSCTTTRHSQNELAFFHQVINEGYQTYDTVNITPRSTNFFSKKFNLSELAKMNPSLYHEDIYKNYIQKEDSINALEIKPKEKEIALNSLKEAVFFKIDDFLSLQDLQEFAKSSNNSNLRWQQQMLNRNIFITNSDISCSISTPLTNSNKTKALIFRKCSSSDSFDLFQLNTKGKWEFVLTATLAFYD